MEKQKKTLIKALPVKTKFTKGNATAEFQSMLLFSRDESGKKHCQFVDRARTHYYLLKDKNDADRIEQPIFIEAEKVEKIEVFYDLLFRDIAKRTGSETYFDTVISSKGSKSSEMKNLFKHPEVYDADTDITDRYIARFNSETLEDPNYTLHKVFFDIEVDLLEDGLSSKGYPDFPDEDLAPCPVNIITLVDGKTKDIFTFIHRNKKNKSLLDFEANLDSHISELREYLFGKTKMEFNEINVEFFDKELDCISRFFTKIHEIDPDYAMAWNQCFDVKTLINRLKKLVSVKGLPYADILTEISRITSDPKYTMQKRSDGSDIEIRISPTYNSRKDAAIVDRMDHFTILDGIQWIDQMLVYANLRKSKLKDSYALDAIANEELGTGKQEFEGEETIKTQPWLNFPKFFSYNVTDVAILLMLENKVMDIDMIQRLSEITDTRAEKVLKKTISIKNFMNKFAKEAGFVMGNNKNANYGEDKTLY